VEGGRRWKWIQLDVRSIYRDPISWIDFDAQSQRMVSTSRGGRAILWDTATGEVAAGPLNFTGGEKAATFFRPNSETSLVTVDLTNGSTWAWELDRNGGLMTTVAGANLGATASASSDPLVLTSSPTGMVIHNLATGASREVRFSSGSGSVRAIAASADGARFVAVYDNGRVELRDAISDDLITIFSKRAEVGGESLIALNHGGTRVAYQAEDGRIVVVDDKGDTVERVGFSSSRRRPLRALDLSDDGREVVVSTDAGEAHLVFPRRI